MKEKTTESVSDLHTQEDALKYVCEEKWGSIDVLRGKIGDEMFERLRSVGCIECGLSSHNGVKFCGTWKKTKTADREVLLYNKPSWREKMLYRIFRF
jgi:hypothetical protein